MSSRIQTVSVAVLLCAILTAGCSERVEAGSGFEQQPLAVEAEGEWVTVLQRSMDSSKPVPEPLVSESDSLRVITSMDSLVSPYTPGIVVTNLLLRESLVPVASVRAEQRMAYDRAVDTTVVSVGGGELSFFVAEHRGITNWTVVVQEIR